MVLWELTLGTAYFLGIRRTYRLGLKIQRKVIPPKYPKIRQFVQRRTRNVFDVALKVHKSIQERDLEVGRNLGNRILRWLDKMKPSAEIRPKDPLSITSKPSKPPSSSSSSTSSNYNTTTTTNSVSKGAKTGDGGESGRHLFTSSRSVFRRNFPSVAMMMQRTKPSGANSQYRHLSMYGPQALKGNNGGFGNGGGAIRKDMMLWMLQH